MFVGLLMLGPLSRERCSFCTHSLSEALILTDQVIIVHNGYVNVI